MPICDRQRPFSKKHNAIMHIFGQKTSFLTKTRVIYFKFCMKDPLLSYPYLVEKYQFCQYYSIVWPKKVNKMVFYPILHEKLMLACPYFIKNTSILTKNTLLSSPYNVKITSILWKTLFSHIMFFSNFLWKSYFCVPHNWSKNTQFWQNYTILWTKKSITCP